MIGTRLPRGLLCSTVDKLIWFPFLFGVRYTPMLIRRLASGQDHFRWYTVLEIDHVDVLGLRSSKLGVVSNRGTLIVKSFSILWLSQCPRIHLGLHPYLVWGLGDVQLSLHFGT